MTMRRAVLLICGLLLSASLPPPARAGDDKILVKQNGTPLGYAKQVNCVGTSSCSVDPSGTVWTFNGTGTGYTGTPGGVAGDLQINGTGIFSPFTGYTCGAGSYATAISKAGALTCTSPTTAMTAVGTGSEIQLRLDGTHLQAYTGDTCTYGYHVTGISSSGVLSCAPDTAIVTATATTYGTVKGDDCPAGQHFAGISNLGTMVCTADSGGTGSSYPPGGAVGSLQVNNSGAFGGWSGVGTAPAGQFLKAVSGMGVGTWAPVPWADITGKPSTYPATVPVATATQLYTTPTTCAVGQSPRGVDTYGNATGCFTPGGGGSPGGADTQIQFNDGGAFGGSSWLTMDKVTGQIVSTGDASSIDALATAGRVTFPFIDNPNDPTRRPSGIGVLEGSSGYCANIKTVGLNGNTATEDFGTALLSTSGKRSALTFTVHEFAGPTSYTPLDLSAEGPGVSFNGEETLGYVSWNIPATKFSSWDALAMHPFRVTKIISDAASQPDVASFGTEVPSWAALTTPEEMGGTIRLGALDNNNWGTPDTHTFRNFGKLSWRVETGSYVDPDTFIGVVGLSNNNYGSVSVGDTESSLVTSGPAGNFRLVLASDLTAKLYSGGTVIRDLAEPNLNAWGVSDYGGGDANTVINLIGGLNGSATPGVAGDGTRIRFQGNDDAGSLISHGIIESRLDSATSTDPVSTIKLKVSRVGATVDGVAPTELKVGGDGTLTFYDGTTTHDLLASGGSAPAGSTTQVQYNNAGVMAGSANLTFIDSTAKTLDVGTLGGTANNGLRVWANGAYHTDYLYNAINAATGYSLTLKGAATTGVIGLAIDTTAAGSSANTLLSLKAANSQVASVNGIGGFSSAAGPGQYGFAMSQTGAYLDLGLGTTDYLYSLGGTLGIRTPGVITADAGFVGALTGNASTATTAGSASTATTANTATALFADGSDCPLGQAPRGVDASGNAVGCAAVGGYTLPAATASVLGGVKGTGLTLVCTGSDKATGFAADGTLQCGSDQTGGAGSANAVEVEVDFGSPYADDLASTVVTGQPWVTASSKVACSPTMLATTDRAEGAEDAVVEGLVASIHTRVASTGFTVTVAATAGVGTTGRYLIHCTGL